VIKAGCARWGAMCVLGLHLCRFRLYILQWSAGRLGMLLLCGWPRLTHAHQPPCSSGAVSDAATAALPMRMVDICALSFSALPDVRPVLVLHPLAWVLTLGDRCGEGRLAVGACDPCAGAGAAVTIRVGRVWRAEWLHIV